MQMALELCMEYGLIRIQQQERRGKQLMWHWI
ncbi:unknown [Lachnospiraceae bacterium CAG:25]|nr:unknown [Lachnospiraceae bacterium CAG:25]